MTYRLPVEDEGVALVIAQGRASLDKRRGSLDAFAKRPGELTAILAQISHLGVDSGCNDFRDIHFLDFKRGLEITRWFQQSGQPDLALHLHFAITHRVIDYLLRVVQKEDSEGPTLRVMSGDLQRVFPARDESQNDAQYLVHSLDEARRYFPVLVVHLRQLSESNETHCEKYATELLQAFRATNGAEMDELFRWV